MLTTRRALLLFLACELLSAGAGFATTSIHILGGFNGWDTSLWQTDPGMTRSGSVWSDSIDIFPWHVQQDYQDFKFVTDRAWDNPPDYVLCADRLDEYTQLAGPVCLIPNGPNLLMYAGVAGRYEMTLDEGALRYSARLIEPFEARITGTVQFGSGALDLPVATLSVYTAGGALLVARETSDAATGSFRIDSLPGGTYDVLVSASRYVNVWVRGVGVPSRGETDLGTVTLPPGCVSAFQAMQVVGDFNNWDPNAPGMTQVSACVWEDTLEVQQGCHFMKFRTDNAWGQDYGTCTNQDPACEVPLEGATCLVDGELALGKMSFPITGRYVFRLEEFAGSYRIRSITTALQPGSWSRVKLRYR